LLHKIKRMQYIIIGGVAGGASTAARLRRLNEKAGIILFEKGAHISYANCGLPYYIGDVLPTGINYLCKQPLLLKAGLMLM